MKIQMKILNKKYYCRSINNNFDQHPFEHNLPKYATEGSAGIDLVCTEDVTIYPGEVAAIHTGLAIYIGSGAKDHYLNYEQKSNEGNYDAAEWLTFTGLIVPRSGLGSKGLILANTIGVIDADYQGELIVQVWNRNNPQDDLFDFNPNEFYQNPFPDENRVELKAGDRFAQLLFIPVVRAQWEIVDEFTSTTERNTGGFGSTNK